MKRIIVFSLFMFPLLGIWAQGTCDRAFDKAVSLYNNGKYKDARMQCSWCQTHCKDRSSTIYQGWLDKCEKKTKEQDKVAARRRKAEAEAIEQRKRETIERKERVERNRYIYLSVSSAVEGSFANIEYELEENLFDIDTSLKFTRDSLEAYWFVRVILNIYGDESNGEDRHFYYVEANIEVEDAVTSQVRRSRVLAEKDGTYTIPEERAPQWVANKIYNKQRDSFYKKILDAITKYLHR